MGDVLDPSDWVKYWRNIVTTMRAVSPALKFDYSVALGSTYANPFSTTVTATQPGVYPGDQYVDVISASMYDQWFGQPACNESGLPLGCKTKQARWDNLVNQRYGLAALGAFAKAHKKPIGFSEWALASTNSFSGGGGGDDVYFMQSFHTWLTTAAANLPGGAGVAYEVYFDKNHDNNIQAMTDGAGRDGTYFPAGAGALQVVLGGTDSLALRVGPPQRGHPDRAGELIPATELVAASVELLPDADAQFFAERDPDSEAGPGQQHPALQQVLEPGQGQEAQQADGQWLHLRLREAVQADQLRQVVRRRPQA